MYRFGLPKIKLATRPRAVSSRGGLALAEVVLASAVVGLLLVSALTALEVSLLTAGVTSRQAKASALAQDLMAEILATRFEDPQGNIQFGPEAGESTTNRAAFDDVDDYQNWQSSPPQSKDGTPLDGFADWSRQVTVQYVDANNDLQPLPANVTSGVKQIVVAVLHENQPLAHLEAVATTSWPIPEEIDVQEGAAWDIPPGNSPPRAVASGWPVFGDAPLSVTFSASDSQDPNGELLSYSWDFGDDDSGSGASVTHTFSEAGIYEVTLMATDTRGAFASDFVTILVK